MVATLSYPEAVRITREALDLADQVERCGGPPEHKLGEFYRARQILEQARDDLETPGMGFLPLVLVPWLLLAAGTVVAVATIPTAIDSARNVTRTVERTTSSVAETLGQVTRWATYGALALGGYWATKTVLRKAG